MAGGRSGGGVLVNAQGAFSMNSGEISRNSCSWSGGGVYIRHDGRFFMAGGVISGNTAGWSGGGVQLPLSGQANFIKTGGTIYGSDGGINANRDSQWQSAIGGGSHASDTTVRL